MRDLEKWHFRTRAASSRSSGRDHYGVERVMMEIEHDALSRGSSSDYAHGYFSAAGAGMVSLRWLFFWNMSGKSDKVGGKWRIRRGEITALFATEIEFADGEIEQYN